jgi:CheY-like chemotaxis protein
MYCAMHPGSAPGPHICLTVSDTGCGIANESLDRIFEPFFTTKDPGKGTGMGLAMVYGIVKNHGGSIRAYSEPGMGATLKVYLPLAETEPKPTPPEPARAPIAGTGVVLVVDDERVVRDLASDILTSLGYTVVAVNDGLEAIDYYTRHAGEIDLAIVDMIMPRMGGRDCFRALKRIDPNVKAILSTGYSRDGEAQRILDEGMIGFAQKPYTVAQLSEIVSRALQ